MFRWLSRNRILREEKEAMEIVYLEKILELQKELTVALEAKVELRVKLSAAHDRINEMVTKVNDFNMAQIDAEHLERSIGINLAFLMLAVEKRQWSTVEWLLRDMYKGGTHERKLKTAKIYFEQREH